MTTAGFFAEWLALREDADANARAEDLLEPLRELPQPRTRFVIHDLGCGTGSMARWLARRWDGPQHWVLHDRDPMLLQLASGSLSGKDVTAEVREGDLAALRGRDFLGSDLVTASALLDLLTADEVTGLAEACVEAGCPALLTLTVAGKVEFTPPDPLDAMFAAAFDAHQRRIRRGHRLLGPDAAGKAVEAFKSLGAEVLTRPSPWRLGPDQDRLVRQWLREWVNAACEQQPDLAVRAPAYLRRRLNGELRVVVHHTDLLAIPRTPT